MRALSSIDPTATPDDLARPLDALERLGPDLSRVAATLTDDPEHATTLVVRALATCAADEPALRDLSAHIATGWLYDDTTRAAASVLPIEVSILHDLRSLAPTERALLALCRFGDHTYREAADTLGVTHLTAASLLTATRRGLAVAGPSDGLADSA